jgi:hypothetical protein
MGVIVYINDATSRVRVHEEDCPKVAQHGGGVNGYYKFFSCYEDAWDYINEYLDDYDSDDCFYCSPDVETCYNNDY